MFELVATPILAVGEVVISDPRLAQAGQRPGQDLTAGRAGTKRIVAFVQLIAEAITQCGVEDASGGLTLGVDAHEREP